MSSLQSVVNEIRNSSLSDGSKEREDRDKILTERLIRSVTDHVSDSHISITHKDGNSRKYTVLWSEEEQCFHDSDRRFFLIGPKGIGTDGKWVIKTKTTSAPGIEALLIQAKMASHYRAIDHMWSFYWQIMCFYHMDQWGGLSFIDLHLKPWDASLIKEVDATKEVLRKKDYI